MENSTVYQEIAKKERIAELRQSVVQVGRKLFGSDPDASALEALDKIGVKEDLKALLDRAFDVGSWEELLGLPSPKPARKKKS